MPHSPDILSYLASVAARSLVLFLVAGAATLVLRVRAAAARHAVWTVVVVGMLTLAAVSPLLPPVPLRVLKTPAPVAQVPDLAAPRVAPFPAPAAPPLASVPQFTWRDAVLGVWALGAAILLGRLFFSYLFTRRLVRAATPISGFDDLFSSAWIAVPMTVGRKVLLPAGWETWDRVKLDAVLAHERTHIRRRDWTIALIAGANRSLFWFHPLAWWLERRLATLAEQACDDSALLLVGSQPYAQALLDMAAAVRTSQGRLVWEAMAMANAAEVRNRIERILDETREIPRALTRARWAVLMVLSLPMIWLVSVTQLVPAAAQEPKTPAAMAEYLKGRRQLSPSDVATMEQYLASNPHDLDVRSQLVMYYYANGVREPRMQHILWLVANHPESTVAIFASQGVLPRDNSLNTYTDYTNVLAAWKQAVATHQGSLPVLSNAARFLKISGEFEEAEKMLLAAGAIEKNGFAAGASDLASLYAAAIAGATGDPQFPNSQPAFSARVRRELETSENPLLLTMTGSILMNLARRPQPGQTLPAGVLNLDDHPLLVSAVDFGRELMARAEQLRPGTTAILGPRAEVLGRVGPGGGVLGGIVGPSGVRSGVPGGGVPGDVRSGVLGGIVGSVPSNGPAPAPPIAESNLQLVPTPPTINSPAPQYPPLARQARIAGVVKLRARIGTDGKVKQLEVITGHPLLVPASLEAVKNWVFQAPASDIMTDIDVPFTLPSGEVAAGSVQGSDSRPPVPKMIKVGGNVQSAKLIRHVDPIYPPQARAEGIQGNVTVQITIDPAGTVVKAEPVEGSPVLAAAAQDAVLQWTYQPTLLNGEPVSVITTVVVPFRP